MHQDSADKFLNPRPPAAALARAAPILVTVPAEMPPVAENALYGDVMLLSPGRWGSSCSSSSLAARSADRYGGVVFLRLL